MTMIALLLAPMLTHAEPPPLAPPGYRESRPSLGDGTRPVLRPEVDPRQGDEERIFTPPNPAVEEESGPKNQDRPGFDRAPVRRTSVTAPTLRQAAQELSRQLCLNEDMDVEIFVGRRRFRLLVEASSAKRIDDECVAMTYEAALGLLRSAAD